MAEFCYSHAVNYTQSKYLSRICLLFLMSKGNVYVRKFVAFAISIMDQEKQSSFFPQPGQSYCSFSKLLERSDNAFINFLNPLHKNRIIKPLDELLQFTLHALPEGGLPVILLKNVG